MKGIKGVLLISVLFSCSKKEPTDWTRSYHAEYTSPYGLLVLNQEIERFEPGFKRVKKNRLSPSEMDDLQFYPKQQKKAFMLIDYDLTWNKASQKKMLNEVKKGNRLLVSLEYLDDSHFNLSLFNTNIISQGILKGKTVTHHLSSPKTRATFDLDKDYSYFANIDQNGVQKLGYFTIEGSTKKYWNFIGIPYGSGYLFLHTNPELFTNYSLLKKSNSAYVEEVIHRLNSYYISWFVNQKREYEPPDNESSYGLLAYIYRQPGLKMAWHLLWVLLLIAVFTYAKRMKSSIRIIPSKENMTLSYTKDIAAFHLVENNYQSLIDTEIWFVLDHLKTTHRLDIGKIDDGFATKMAFAINCHPLSAEDFVRYVKKHRARERAYDFDFEEFRKIILKLNL